MPDIARASSGAIMFAIALSLLILLVWVAQLATLADLGSSDAAGNAMAQAYAGIEIILLWVLLAVLLIVAGVAGVMPWQAVVAAAILLPASGFAALTALGLLTDHDAPPFLWPIITPALVPPLVVTFGFWALLPSLRGALPARLASGIAWGLTLLLCIFIWPMAQIRDRAVQQELNARAKWAADFAGLAPNAPLWDWTPLLQTRDETRVAGVLDRIHRLDRRQADAETMLDRGDFPLLYLGSFDLDPTPAICDKARNLLRRRVPPLVPKLAGSRPYAEVAEQVASAVAAMNWLVGYGCSCDEEAKAWESMANAYRDANFDVVRLKELRDPKELGSVWREHPARFSMLSPQSHLRAWLGFADDKDLRDQALAGARSLDHRTEDATEMLNQDESTAGTVLKFMPVLDLEATPALCNAALRALYDRFTPIYRPRPEDPRPYDELLARLGVDSPLTALQWLASHGCDADAALSEAQALVRTYQDSPDRAAMLASLAQLHRKP